jgi:hypothetical protein
VTIAKISLPVSDCLVQRKAYSNVKKKKVRIETLLVHGRVSLGTHPARIIQHKACHQTQRHGTIIGVFTFSALLSDGMLHPTLVDLTAVANEIDDAVRRR